jgi:transposase
MRACSLDLRKLVVGSHDRGGGSVREVAEQNGIAPNTVQNYLTRRWKTGEITPAPHGGGPPRLLGRLTPASLAVACHGQSGRRRVDITKRATVSWEGPWE